MEIIFRARTCKTGGIFINGKLITSRWNSFSSTDLYNSCLKIPAIEIQVYENKEFHSVNVDERQATSDEVSKKEFIKNFTLAQLKVYLIEEKGLSKKEVNSLNKPELLQIALS